MVSDVTPGVGVGATEVGSAGVGVGVDTTEVGSAGVGVAGDESGERNPLHPASATASPTTSNVRVRIDPIFRSPT